MDAQRTPDELTTENELICTKLLGWNKCEHIAHIPGLFHTPAGAHEEVPSFTAWADAGLILDALRAAALELTIATVPDGWWCEIDEGPNASYDDSGPLTIRAAALAYIRSLP